MSKLIVSLLSAAGGLIIGGFSGRKTSNITFGDVKAAPRKVVSSISNTAKKAGKKIGSGFSTLAFWKKKKEVKKKTVNHEQNYQNLSKKHAKLSDDFSTTVKRMNLVETDLSDRDEQLRQEKEKNEAFRNTVDDQDAEIKQMKLDLTSAQSVATAALKKQEKSTSKN